MIILSFPWNRFEDCMYVLMNYCLFRKKCILTNGLYIISFHMLNNNDYLENIIVYA